MQFLWTIRLEDTKQHKAAKMSNGVIYMDIAAAYDSVRHRGLLCTLIKHGLPKYLTHWSASYCAERVFTFTYGNTQSTYRDIPAGLLHGSCLSSKLYSSLTADPPVYVDVSVFVDETAISVNGTQQRGFSTNRIPFIKLHIVINMVKT